MQDILRVNLTTREFDRLTIPNDWQEKFVGGASLAARLLYERLTPGLEPFDPDSPLLFLNGPLTGTAGPAVGRFVICGKSPATRLWAETNCGGFWGPELRMAGYDGLWVEGKSDQPVYLLIYDEHVEIRPASSIWGLDTYSTQEAVENDVGKGKLRVAAIGPAGEALIPFALILTDHGRVAGRTGMGAVMGSKNLKAVAVKGHGEVPVFDLQGYGALRTEANRTLRSESLSIVLRELGTSSVADYFDYLYEMPKKYFQSGAYPETSRVSGSSLKETLLAGVSACHACVIACGRVVRLEDGIRRKGPEYETLVGFGPNLWLNDPVFVTRMGELCDRYGLDTISMSNIIGLAFKLFEQGRIGAGDTGGYTLDWGNSEVVEKLVHDTARKQGFGAQLAEGALALGRRYSADDEAVQVNGLEVPYHDPRGASGMALVYATSPRGACHNQSDYFLADIGQIEKSLGMKIYPRQGGAEKARNVALHQDWRTFFNSLVICNFANLPPESLIGLVRSACGYDWGLSDLLLAGERGWNLKRVINNRLGLTRINDKLPKPLLEPYQDAEKSTDFVPDIAGMLSMYYQARGWDPVNGFPTIDKLTQLDLEWAARDIWHDAVFSDTARR